MKLLPVIASAASLFAADAAKVWTAQEIADRLAKAKPEAHQVKGTSLEAFKGYRMSANRRDASGIAEMHEHVDDIFVIESGQGTLVTGGSIPGSKVQSPGEVRGAAIEGGTKHKVAAGDFVHIPAGTPHQMLLEAGKQITYAVVKVDAR